MKKGDWITAPNLPGPHRIDDLNEPVTICDKAGRTFKLSRIAWDAVNAKHSIIPAEEGAKLSQGVLKFLKARLYLELMRTPSSEQHGAEFRLQTCLSIDPDIVAIKGK